MSEIIDLDALVPPSVTVQFNGESILIAPPKTADVFRIGILGQTLQNMGNLTDAELDQCVEDLTAQIFRCVPELLGQNLNTQQLLKLVEALSSMAIPPDVKELDKRGITVGDPKAPPA